MPSERPGSEVGALADLLGDFAVEGWGPGRAEEAFDLVLDRSRVLSQSYVAVSEAVATAVDPAGPAVPMPAACRTLLFAAHHRLFDGILTNAGLARRADDPGGSGVGYGGMRWDGRATKFQGAPAARIDGELVRAFARLRDHRTGGRSGREAARDEAIRFYADLSAIHPFYEANGRTGRFVVSVYLHLHGWLVEWGRLDAREGKFMRKINSVNRRADGQTDYDAILVDFWRQYVVPTDGLG